MKSFAPLFAALCLLTCCSEPSLRVGILVSDSQTQSAESEALSAVLSQGERIVTSRIAIDNLEGLDDCDVVWYHRPDTCAASEAEIEAGTKISKWVADGGELVLSMDGVRLLNVWGIEPQPVETYTYDAIDEGFGRKLGFHAYRSHPIFDCMFGGAYPWHGKEDNTCRLNGFTGNNLPQAEGAKVIATQWEYIFNRPDKKLIWQTPVGKGSVLAIGGCLYYGRDNFHTAILDKFTVNCVDFLGGCPTESEVRYWDYSPATVVESAERNFRAVRMASPKQAELPSTDWTLSREATGNYFDVSTPHSMLIGQERGGIDEIWTHPFMSLRDYRVWLEIDGNESLVLLSSLKPEVEICPYGAVRRYRVGDICLTETIVSSVDRPVTVVHYQWSGKGLRSITTDFKSNLRYMWPYDEEALGSIEYCWSQPLNAFVVSDSGQEFCSITGADLRGEPLCSGRYDGFSYEDSKCEGIATDKLQAACAVRYDVATSDALDVVISAAATGTNDAVEAYTAALRNPDKITIEAAAYYDDYFADKLTITTPDKHFNEALRWAQISSAQFIVDTPEIGTSLMAGYSSSRRGWGGGHAVSGRPGYAWYFGRDAVWSAFAFDDMGDFATVRNVLSTLIKFQQIDGKIYHELTSSGFVHFDASDATPLFVNLMAHYLRWSGDLNFVKANFGAVEKAIAYCRSTDTDGDGLIEIANVGHGWLEGGELFGCQTEFYLCGIWKAALDDAAYIAELCADNAAADRYKAESKAIEPALEAFWNEKGYYNYAKRADCTFTEPLLVLAAVPVYFDVVDGDRAKTMTERLIQPDMLTDWGARTISEDSTVEGGGAYAPRHVWPLFTGWSALAQYRTGFYTQGFATVFGSLNNYKGMALGHIAEVINADAYRNNGITLHQCWSETMAIMPLVEGMLGFEPDAIGGSAKLSPRLPFDWQTMEVENLSVGKAKLAMRLDKGRRRARYTLRTNKRIDVAFAPTLPPASTIESVSIDGRPTEWSITDNGSSITLAMNLCVDKECVVEIACTEGASALAAVPEAVTDEQSSGFKVLGQRVVDGALEIVVVGRAESSHTLELYLPNGYERIEGATAPIVVRDGVVSVEVDFDKSDDTYTEKIITVVPLR